MTAAIQTIAPPPFEYARPETLEEALRELSRDGAMPLAGGTDLVAMRADGRVAPELIVDLKGIAELRGIDRASNGELSIGALTTMAELAADRDPRAAAVRDGAGVVGSTQTRNRATLGGNVCRASPAGDSLPGLLAVDARACVRGPAGERRIALRELFTGPGSTVLDRGELLSGVVVSHAGGSAYRRLTYRAWMDLAVMGVAVALRIERGECVEASVALGGVAPTPILAAEAGAALVGSGLEEAAIEAAAEAAVEASRPIDDVRGTAAYRLDGIRALMPTVTARAAERAASPAVD